MLQHVLPNDKLEPIPPDDHLWQAAFDLTRTPASGTEAYQQKFRQAWAPLHGIRRQGRWIVVYSPTDFCSDLDQKLHDRVPGYLKESAFQLVVNILHEAFTP